MKIGIQKKINLLILSVFIICFSIVILSYERIVEVIVTRYTISNVLEFKRLVLVTFCFIFLIGVLIIMLIGKIIKHWVVTPIIRLNDGLKKIEIGNFDYSIKANQNDEIGELVRDFNIITKNLKTSFTSLQKRNKLLEEKVTKGAKELHHSLSCIQDLKMQQEEEYFYIRNIANTLMQNQSKSSFVKIDFITEQKKKFQFKGKTHSIGGDICIAGNLNFFGKNFTLFFNGDTMSNSLQGVCGSLVISSMVNSIMTRSVANKRAITKEPDRWLKEVFAEMQKVIESFEGEILVSCILGIVEDETGHLQFFNAGHPPSILFRNGKANFIAGEASTHKLGLPFNITIELNQLQMQPNDVFFCGSNGKEDLILEMTNLDHINTDPKLFLQTIDESKGILDNIYRNLREVGELSDDLSLIRISFKEDIIVREQTDTSPLGIDRVSNLMKKKSFSKAYKILEQETDKNNIVNLYRRAYCLNQLHRNSEAVILLENANRQIKQHPKILKLLAKIHFEMSKK